MPTLALRSLFDVLGFEGQDLLLRSYGKQSFPVIEKALLDTKEGESLTLEFDGISVMDTSFADETIVEILVSLTQGKYGDRFLILKDPSSATLDNLEGTIARRKAKVALLISQNYQIQILGHIEPNLFQAWKLAKSNAGITARQLSDMLNLEINTASTRLAKLYKARLLRRDEEMNINGRQHIYQVPG